MDYNHTVTTFPFCPSRDDDVKIGKMISHGIKARDGDVVQACGTSILVPLPKMDAANPTATSENPVQPSTFVNLVLKLLVFHRVLNRDSIMLRSQHQVLPIPTVALRYTPNREPFWLPLRHGHLGLPPWPPGRRALRLRVFADMDEVAVLELNFLLP